MQYTESTITAVERPADGFTLLRFKGDTELHARPGQFAMVRGAWGPHPVLPRAFSLVKDGPEPEILLRTVGEGTALLADMRLGDKLFVLGPLGRGFGEPAPNESPILVAGGVGVAPLVFLARELVRLSSRASFIYGAKTSSELPLRSDIEALAALALSTEDGTLGQKGRATDLLRSFLSAVDSPRVFACGPRPMLEAVARLCREAEAPCEVALESPMGCGMGTCKGCAVPGLDGDYRYVCSDGPVFDALTIFGGQP